MGVLNKIIGDENRLLAKGKKALIPPSKKSAKDFKNGSRRVVGYLPQRLRTTYTLLQTYKKKFAAAKAEADRTELAGLIGATEYRWETRWGECREAIKRTDDTGGEPEILKDWAIAAVIINVAGRKG
ncbi:MAG: hypothetical protein PHE24_00010 [Patescibacteria group bacterium]|nr:hypothetical protein [Patescibacteria group bacterium]